MNLNIGTNKVFNINLLCIIFSLFGIVFAYSVIYAYHILVLFYILLFIYRGKVNKENILLNIEGWLLYLYIILSVIWSSNTTLALYDIFYFFCGFMLVWIITEYVNDFNKLDNIFKIFCIIMIIQIIISIFEIMGVIRLPSSPFSPYSSYLGRESFDVNQVFSSDAKLLYSMPTGFTGNPNNLSFILLLSMPFLWCFLKHVLWRFIFSLLILYIIYYTDSRGLVISYMLMLFFSLCLFLIKNYNTKKVIIIFPLLTFIFISILFFFKDKLIEILNEIFLAFEYLKYGGFDGFDSTAARAYIYREGFYKFLEAPWFGHGIGSMKNHLIEFDFPVKSFHFFPFELLIDIGIIPFIFIFYMYFKILSKLFTRVFISKEQVNLNLATACFLSLVIYPIASIVPSSTIYILPAWFILGFSLALIKVSR